MSWHSAPDIQTSLLAISPASSTGIGLTNRMCRSSKSSGCPQSSQVSPLVMGRRYSSAREITILLLASIPLRAATE